MLSYQHGYHAGNLADIHKHSILSVVLAQLVKKDRALSYMETHAGRGIYNLTSTEAQKTGEAEQGIIAISKAEIFPKNHPYVVALEKTKAKHGKNFYAGSPAIAESVLRKKDKINLMELHPQEFLFLKRNVRGYNVSVHKRDGYEGVMALSPPEPRRGLVLIDPSYEVKMEYNDVVKFITLLVKKWPEATLAIWYPMLKADYHASMIKQLQTNSFNNTIHEQFIFGDPKTAEGMYGSGMFIINCPFGADVEIKKISRLLDSYIASRK